MKRAKEEAVRTSQQIGAAVQTISTQTTTSLAAATRTVDSTTKSFERLGKTVGGGRSSTLGLGMLAVGQMVDDMQYGFRSIVNNIPQVTYLMGGSAGLAGGIGIAAVAVNLLVNHWDQLIDRMQAGWLNVAAGDLEKLRVATEKAGDAFDALMKTPSELGAREIAKLKEAITDLQKGGGAAVFKGIAEGVAIEPGLRAEETPAEQKQRKFLEDQIKNPPNWLGAPGLVEDLKKQLAAMDKHMNERNGEIARALIGRSLMAGEDGDGARAQLKRLVEKFPGSFSPAFRAALQRNTPEMLQGEIDLENAKKARERARGVAGQLLGSPLGTQVMLGGGGAGPATAAALAQMMAPSKRRFGPLANDMIKQMTDAGLTEEQAKQVLSGMGPRQSYNRGKTIGEKLGVPLGPGGALDNRVVGQAIKELFAEGMKAVVGKPGGMEAAVGKVLKGAGVVGQEPKEVLAEMQAQLVDRRKQLMLERGLTKRQADAQILREQQQRAFPESFRPAAWVGAIQLAKMGAVGALSGGGDVPKRSLDELILIRKGIAALRAGRIMQAVAAGPE
jgi:hypothetical protein